MYVRKCNIGKLFDKARNSSPKPTSLKSLSKWANHKCERGFQSKRNDYHIFWGLIRNCQEQKKTGKF